MPKVSVILTSYNHEQFIGESIRSVLSQTFTDFELIIWDDASSDNSWKIIGTFSDSRIRCFQNPERFMGGSANRGIEVAQGEYIAIHHSDDVWNPKKLEMQVAFLDAHPQIGAVFSNAEAIDERGQPLASGVSVYSTIFNQRNRTRHEWLNQFFYRGNALCHPSVLIRKTCYESCGKYPAYGLAQLGDFDMWIRLCLKYEIHVFPEKLVRFRVRDNAANVSGNRPEVRIRDRSEFHHILKHYFRISSFNELSAIFPEAQQFRRDEGCEPQFVMSMIAISESALPWARFLGIQTLYDLLSDERTRDRLKTLYNFDYRQLIAISGQHDLFLLETVAQLNEVIESSNDTIFRQAEVIGYYEQREQPRNSGLESNGIVRPTSQYDLHISIEERETYKIASNLIESGNRDEGLALLEMLAAEGSRNWEVHNDIAVEYFKAGDYAAATPHFIKGLELEGRSGTTARNFATMLTISSQLEAALVMWGTIIRDQPQDSDAINVVREILARVSAVTPQDWLRLVANIRGDSTDDCVEQLKETLARPRHTERSRRTHDKSPRSATRRNDEALNEVRIHQIYYDETTRLQIDPHFIPLDNTDSTRPDWYEYWPIRKVLLNQTFEDSTYLGFFSPRFSNKTGMNGRQVMDIAARASDEILSFSPYFDQGAIHANPFIQGESNHPGLLETSTLLFAHLNIDVNLKELYCDQTTTIFSNFFVARYSFWKVWLSYAERILELCEGPESDLKTRLVSPTPHRNGLSYAMKVFVMERLVTVVMEHLGIQSKVEININEAPMLLPTSRDNLAGLIICDALKGQYRNTGLDVYRDTFHKIRYAT